MWCPSCKADVAAEVTADNRRIQCANCGGEISATASFSGLSKTREARDLLERWASERNTEPAASRSDLAEQRPLSSLSSRSGGGISLEAESRAPSAKNSLRVDSPQPLSGPSAVVRRPAATPASDGAFRTLAQPESSRVHRQHDSTQASPHFDIQANLLDSQRKKTNWSLIIGQLLAYAGVALLTVGSTLVLWSYFGGPPSYGPTGWLTTTAGQMLLFLGVVTLVSGGLEQTSDEVRTRIERLGERIIRIEQIARDQSLRGPNLPAEYYAAGGTTSTGADAARRAADSRP